MKSLLPLKKYFFRYKNRLLLGFLFILVSDAAQVMIPLFMKNGIDSLRVETTSENLLKYALLIVGAAFVAGLFRFLIRETIIVVSRKIEFDLRQDFWIHLQSLSYKFYQNNSTGDLMAHATNDISAVRMFLGPAVMYSVDTFIKMVFIITIIFSLNYKLAIYALLPLPLLSFFVYRLSKKINVLFTRIQEKFAELTTKVQESISGIRVVKSYVRQENEINEFTKLSNDYLHKSMDKVRVQALFMPILFLISGISIIIVIWLGGDMVIEGIMTIGGLAAFIAYLVNLIWPMIASGWVMNIIQQSSASMKRLNKIMEQTSDIEELSVVEDSQPIKGEIEFRNVSFRYNEEFPFVLKDINLKIKQGTTIAIIGKTGEGKTSLINLITRLYDVTEGKILIDGKDVKNIPLKKLRQAIGVVPQETFLFSDTLKNNILYGIKENDGLLEKVASISRIDKDVYHFPRKYDTILGEGGITLSGGQKQRTCLARALAINPQILILDDTFSAVDTNTEEEILNNLNDYMKNRTNIIISHRISTVKNANRIYVLEKGKIVEEGKHAELIDKNGIYADIYKKQLLEEELAGLN